MQIKFKIIICGIIGLLLLSPFFVYAEGDRDPMASSYLFFLYYDNGQLFANRDFEFKYDVIPEAFIPETINTAFPYKGEIINLNNQVAATFQFDPRRGDPKFLKGIISVKAPYVPDGQKAVFSDAQGQQLLTIFVSESSFCNDDGVCNADIGEDQTTCPLDCKSTPIPIASPDVLAGGQSNMLMTAIYVLISIGVVLGGWFGWRWWKNRKKNNSPSMSQYPPTNLPPQQPLR